MKTEVEQSEYGKRTAGERRRSSSMIDEITFLNINVCRQLLYIVDLQMADQHNQSQMKKSSSARNIAKRSTQTMNSINVFNTLKFNQF